MVELATGDDDVEKWSVLPNDWKLWLNMEQVFVQKNFALIRFHPQGPAETPVDTGDILILNLVSRKQFWMREQALVNKILQKLNDSVEYEEWEPITFSRYLDLNEMIKQMKVLHDGIAIKCKHQIRRYGEWQVGQFEKIHNLC